MAGYSLVLVPAQPMRLTRILALSPVQSFAPANLPRRRQHPTAVARRLGVVQATGLGVDINPRIALGQVGVTGVPNQWPLPCERKYDRRLTSGDAAIMPLSPKAARQPERWATASPTHVLSDGRSHLTRRRPEHRTREDLDPREHLAEASERLSAAMGALGSPLYALSARADARAEIDAVILILVRQLRLAQWPPPWERIGGGR
jgi:hypothetical protein